MYIVVAKQGFEEHHFQAENLQKVGELIATLEKYASKPMRYAVYASEASDMDE